MSLQVGARVRVISNEGRILAAFPPVFVPSEGTVSSFDPDDDLLQWSVTLEDGQDKWFSASDLEVLS